MRKKKIQEINVKLLQNNTWHNHDKTFFLKKKFSFLTKIVKDIELIDTSLKDVIEITELAEEENNNEIMIDIQYDINNINVKLKNIENKLIFYKEHDKLNCYMDIQSGSGGIESQDWSNILLRMYVKWANIHNIQAEITEESTGEIAGIKYATVKFTGKYAYGWLRTETGVHRLVRKSPFDSNNRRHTSFSSIFVYPEIHENINLSIKNYDLRIDVYKSSGSGGQHVNSTESAVRITHIPTNIVVQCQNERSQHQNKEQAMKQLKSKIYKKLNNQKKINKEILNNSKLDIAWGNQIRSYILDNSRIKDIRTGMETRNTQSFLNGNIDKFIIASIKKGIK